MIRRALLALALLLAPVVASAQALPAPTLPLTGNEQIPCIQPPPGSAGAVTKGCTAAEIAATGGGGTPAGSNTQVQFNSGGAFGATSNVAITGPSPVKGLTVSGTNLNAANNLSDLIGFHPNCTNNGTTSNIGFVDENCVEIDALVTNRVNVAFGNGTSGKKTFLPLFVNATYYGGGQRINIGNIAYCFGPSDCATMSNEILAFNTYPISGDEGTGITEQGNIQQQSYLVQTVVVSASKDTCTGTITSTVTASQVQQTVPFTLSSGSCSAGDYVEINAGPGNNSPNYTWMKIVSFTGGNLTGIIPINLTINAPVTPTTTVIGDGSGNFSSAVADLPVVYLNGSSYSTGTITGTTGNQFNMSGATITNSVVGGDANAIGCFAATADNYSQSPFNSTGTQGTLKAWYEIQTVSGNNPTVFSDTIASSTGLRTYAPTGSAAYIIRPCVRAILVGADGNTNKIILGTNNYTTPSPGDKLEFVLQPFPDVHGYSVGITDYTTGSFNRYAYDAYVFGPREWQVGYFADGSAHATGGNADKYGILTGFQCLNCGTAFSVSVGDIGAQFQSMAVSGVIVSGSSATGYGFDSGAFPVAFRVENSNTHGIEFDSGGGPIGYLDTGTFTTTRTITLPDASGVVALQSAVTKTCGATIIVTNGIVTSC